jgi:hypothetical protein
LTQPFDRAAEIKDTYYLNMVINGQTTIVTTSFKMRPDVRNGVGINPQSVSPVLKTAIEVTIDPDFPYALAKEDFTVNATSTATTGIYVGYERYLNVLSVTDVAATDDAPA